MKKFLTVLLALSVVFTYSVSAVFADATPTDTEKAAVLAEAKTIAENMVNTYYNDAMKVAIASTKSDVNAKVDPDYADADYETAWGKVDVKGLLATKIAEEYVAEAKTFTNYVADAATYAAKVFGISTKGADGNEVVASAITSALATKIKTVAEKQAMLNLYNTKKEELMSALDKVDYSLYLDTVDPQNTDGKTYLQEAQEKVAAAKKAISEDTAATLNEDTITATALAGGVDAVKDTVDATVASIKISGTSYDSGLYSVVGIKTKTEVENQDRVDAATVAEIKAAVQKNYVVVMNGANADKANADAYVTVCNYLAEKGFITAIGDIPSYGSKDWKTPVSQIEELTAFADKYKAEKDATGALVRDSAAVDAEVEKATNKVYGDIAENAAAQAKGQTIADAETHIKNMSVTTAAAELAFAKEAAKKAVENAKADAADKYYPLEATKLDAKYAEILAEIDAATTVTKVTTAQSKITNAANGINDKDAVDGITLATSAAAADLADVKYQVEYLNRGKTILDAGYIDATDAQINAALAKIYGEAGARTNKEIDALTIDVAAVVASLPTVGAKADAKKAVEDAIKALPAQATESDLAAVEAAWNAKKAYEELGGVVDTTLTSKLNTAISQVKTDMLKNLTIAEAQLDKTDKAAVKALKEKVDAAVKLDKKDALFGNGTTNGTTFDALDTKVTTALKTLRANELANVIKAINAIPLNVTEADKAVVEAARAAYDAFVKEWTDYEEPYDAASAVTNFRELALAEATLSLNDNPGKDVEALKITASSTQGKNYIKVKWTVKGDADAADGYQIYRSTKKNSGYKKFFTTTKKTYKNTKTLKKGTRYYYKVRAYKVVDGKTYYSDWSNKAYRTYKYKTVK